MCGGGMGLCGRCMVYLAIVGGYVCGVGGGWVCVPLLVLAVVVGPGDLFDSKSKVFRLVLFDFKSKVFRFEFDSNSVTI